jgi:hypothetical protein
MRFERRHEQTNSRPLPHHELVPICASLKKRGSLQIWLDKAMTWLAPPDGCPGHPAVFSDGAI